jgi:hypothetical protein
MKTEDRDIRRHRMGRPRLNPETVRCNRIVTFVTNSELAKLEHKAGQERASLSSVVHQILSDFLRKT